MPSPPAFAPSLPVYLPPTLRSPSRHPPITAQTAPRRPPAAAPADASQPGAKRAASPRRVPPGAVADANYDPRALRVAGALPPGLAGTLYFAAPALAPHIAAAAGALAHARDGDGYVLALSVEEGGGVWVRARFVRTKPYMREAREGRRVYRGRYGTAGSRGLAAPVRWKRTCGDGVFVWGKGKKRRLVAFGAGGLPMGLDMGTLASRGPVGMGACLTDAPELASVRCAEVSARPVEVRGGEGLAFCARSRGSTGKVTGINVYEVDEGMGKVFESRRLPFPADGVVAAFAVSDSWYAVLYSQVKSGGGLMKLLGKSDDDGSGLLDDEFGTRVLLIPTRGGEVARKSVDLPLGGVYVTGCARAVDHDGSMLLDLTVVDTSAKTMAQLADACDGRPGSAEAVLRRYRVGALGVEVVVENVHAARDGLSAHRTAYVKSDNVLVSAVTEAGSGRCGIAVVENSGEGEALLWEAGSVDTGVIVSEPVPVGDGPYVAAVVSGNTGSDSRAVVLDSRNIKAGPVADIEMPATRLGPCVGGVWSKEVFTWEEFGGKKPTSSYELFDDKRWNDVNNGFSSFGLNQIQ